MSSILSAGSVEPVPASRFLSEPECRALQIRAASFAQGGGMTEIGLTSRWTGNLRFARNRITSSGDLRNNALSIKRTVRGAAGYSNTNQVDDLHLRVSVLHAERWEEMGRQSPAADRLSKKFIEPYPAPKIWFDTTYNQDAAQRADLMRELVKPAQAAGMLAAGYIEVRATGQATMDPVLTWYYPYTEAQYSVTVRDPQGTGSGWAGVDWNDWARIDPVKLSAIALDKCLRSRNPVRLEPGRYTTILEPQAVGDLVRIALGGVALSRLYSEQGDPRVPAPVNDDPYSKKDNFAPFGKSSGWSKLGEKVIDERLTVRTDNMDPDLGFPPFNWWQVYHPATWIQDGVLQELAYYREYAVKILGRDTGGQPVYGEDFNAAFRMSVKGETATIDEMIATTKRGVLVTRFSDIVLPPADVKSLLVSGFTRDGLWLIENGKISHAIKNFRFTESPLFVLNNIEQIGIPQRIFSPRFPKIVPALKVRDFSFTSLSDAV